MSPDPNQESEAKKTLEEQFESIRRGIIGYDVELDTVSGPQRMRYMDWTASGRAHAAVEDAMREHIVPHYGNSHSEDSFVGLVTTQAYELAHEIIRYEVNGAPEDIVLTCGSGSTVPINRLQRIMDVGPGDVVITTDMEHHANELVWRECGAKVHTLKPDEAGLPSLDNLEELAKQGAERRLIGSFTACSNVTGVQTPIHEMAQIVHENGGVCFADYAASAPYVAMNMRPDDPLQKLDAIFFSPHKALGGPGSAGVIVFDGKLLYPEGRVPVTLGGGIVDWTSPHGSVHQRYIADPEHREDAGTPALLQAIRAALALQLKREMGVDRIAARKAELLKTAFEGLAKVSGLEVLEARHTNRQGIVSFIVPELHHGLVVTLLNDYYAIQTRGGCSCAGTYGHRLFNIGAEESRRITDLIDRGDNSQKPGWVRMSLHPTLTNADLDYTLDAIAEVVRHGAKWRQEYEYDARSNAWSRKHSSLRTPDVSSWFDLSKRL